MSLLKLLGSVVLIALLTSCASAPGPPPKLVQEEVAEKQTDEPVQPTPEQTKLLERLNEFYNGGLQKLDQGAISEGITQLVSVLAETSGGNGFSREIIDLVHNTETELSKVMAGLEMEAGTEWIDENKNQISASSIDVSANEGLNPSVILTFNFGAGRVLVSGAPIFFEFVNGSGLLTNLVTTNEYGQANCSLARLDSPNDENIIKASLIYQVKGFTYRFDGLERDFVFVPPARRATILVLERAADLVSDDPIILDAVYNRLRDVTFDFSQYNGVLLGDSFMRVFGGDPDAIKAMGLEKGVSYLVMVLNDGYYVNQVELAGKKYNIFKSQTTATARIIRVIDGKIIYSGSVQAVSGQGGTRQKAILDGLRNAAEAMSKKISADLPRITAALAPSN